MELNSFLKQSKLYSRIVNNIDNKVSQSVFSATQGEKTLLLLSKRSSLLLTDDFVFASALNENLQSMGEKSKFITFNETPIFVKYKDLTSSHEFICAIYDFLLNKIDYLICSNNCLLQKLPNKNILLNNILELKINNKYNFKDLSKKLIKIGYKKVETIEKKAEFSIRGDIIDIYPLNSENPLKLEFFDDELEKISSVDLETKQKIDNFKEFQLYPATIIFYDEKNIQEIQEKLNSSANLFKLNGDKLLKQQEILSSIILNINELNTSMEMQYILPALNYEDNVLSLFKDKNIFVDEPKKVLDGLKSLKDSYLASCFEFVSNGDLLPLHYDFVVDEDKCLPEDINYTVFQTLQTKSILTQEDITLKIVGSQKYVFDFKALLTDIKTYLNSNCKILLACANQQNYDIVFKFLTNNVVSCMNFETCENIEESNVFVSTKNIPYSASFLDGRLIIIGTDDLFKKNDKKPVKLSNKNKVFYLPKIGDYAVHSVHGIGKCIALEKLNLSGVTKDYFILEYDKGDKLFVPSEQANLITAYMGSDKLPKLNKLGGLEFSKLKEKVKASVKELAINLLELYSKRDKMKGFVYSKDNYLMEQFEENFPYEETQDQLVAIADIKKDMESTKIMDRLICGDVGFGKTEVALRAVYKAVLDNKQVAILCPTSILSEQHYKTCKSRFDGFMVNVEVINRLKTKQQQENIVKRLKEGKIDVICGTHRLLSKDIEFKNLGLLVLDEEQRFGVGDKEKIKSIKSSVDVLTLSATPIPRTLNMSLTGLRDISIIETPPKDRIPVQTYVTEFSTTLLYDVCKRELSRNGQVLIIYNRVESIYDFKKVVEDLLPNIPVGVAHGQMSERELTTSINKLFSEEYKIMICTTLIENGVDLPNANTLFVIDADRLGLSQLYQLRGRIGRSNKLAYAYFTFNGNKELTEDAYKRLSCLMEFTELGSGFKIAMRDLEIRGAGDVLGREQHGHMTKVGYDMYSKILKETVEELKGNKQKELLPIKIDIEISAFIPENYVPNEQQRIKIYTNISEIMSAEDFEKCKEELINSYGEIPIVVINLMKIALIKNLAQKIEIKRILLNNEVCELYLYKKEEIISNEISTVISNKEYNCVLKFKDLPIIVMNLKSNNMSDKLDELLKFLQECV